MEITLKEPLLVTYQHQERTIRQGTVALQRNNTAWFLDVTKTFSVGFPVDSCTDNPNLFKIARDIHDREVSVRDVILALSSCDIPDEHMAVIREKINSL